MIRSLRETRGGSLSDSDIVWSLTGSLAHRLHGLDVTVDDVDIIADEPGAYAIAVRFAQHVLRPVAQSSTETIRSHFGELSLLGRRVEIMGAVQLRAAGGGWGPPIDVARRREHVTIGGLRVPVMPLEDEAAAYRKLGRPERAELIERHLLAMRDRGPRGAGRAAARTETNRRG